MAYCRYCGTEISYKRSKNDKWIPCNLLTGEPHFCNEKKETKINSGLIVCSTCGKAIFIKKNGNKKEIIDYSTLCKHECKKADVTRYLKYKKRQRNKIN